MSLLICRPLEPSSSPNLLISIPLLADDDPNLYDVQNKAQAKPEAAEMVSELSQLGHIPMATKRKL